MTDMNHMADMADMNPITPVTRMTPMTPMTPLLDALRARAARSAARFHMPGHAGRAAIAGWEGPFAIDFTELRDTGNLYTCQDKDPIREAGRLYAERLGAEGCLFLTGGATQGNLAMLSAVAAPGDTVVLDRNCHFSVHNALALIDLRPVWVQAPLIEPFSVTAGLPPDALASALDANPGAACALVTSPTYYGVMSDWEALASVCHARGVPLLADAAHGAHLPFLPGFVSPVAQGAAAAVLSAHKTLPALGQTALLINGKGIPEDKLRHRAALFGSSSPSYVLMASLDAARDYMENGGSDAMMRVSLRAQGIRQSAPGFLGFAPPATGHAQPLPVNQPLRVNVDPLRLCLYTGQGKATADRLEGLDGIVCEMSDPRNAVFLLSAMTTQDELLQLEMSLKRELSRLPDPPPPGARPPAPLPETRCTPRQALFSGQVQRPWRDCLGRVAAEPVSLYPPGAPLVARGEVIDEQIMEALAQANYQDAIWIMDIT
ncbi:MAG: DegT/DnrJ/EryC1/StrS family aminotransferase [Oscillospiraceae bacterium]|nr:DegT/DnrJ/EryC1/StrS family aminotransferase [Oscillospiraceae bacterium]